MALHEPGDHIGMRNVIVEIVPRHLRAFPKHTRNLWLRTHYIGTQLVQGIGIAVDDRACVADGVDVVEYRRDFTGD